MTGPVFVDTNVFVYRHDASDAAKQARAQQWIALLARSRTGRLSFQVLQELYATLTRVGRLNFDPADARQIVDALATWQPIPIELGILRRAWLVEERFRLAWWDALIVATAQAAECPVLLTEDLQNGQVFDGLRVVDPFAAADSSPQQVLEVLG
ncbi:MAG: PIN domain-containing protein [Acidobacteria bacterium]|nr:PIN domain-containing protein [Acidobacteriota bacterium]